MNAQPNYPQAVVYHISNTKGNHYVDHTIKATTPEAKRAECPTENTESQKQARPPPSPPLDAQNNFTRLTGTSHANSNNLTGFHQWNVARTLNHTQSPIKETMAGMTQELDVALITHQENSILDSNDHSTIETPTNEVTACLLYTSDAADD